MLGSDEAAQRAALQRLMVDVERGLDLEALEASAATSILALAFIGCRIIAQQLGFSLEMNPWARSSDLRDCAFKKLRSHSGREVLAAERVKSRLSLSETRMFCPFS